MNVNELFQSASSESMTFLLKLLAFALLGLIVLHPSIALGIGFIFMGCYLGRQVYVDSSSLVAQQGGSARRSES